MKKVRITKISDDAFDGNHPNGINEGFTIEGYEVIPMQVGERYVLSRSKTYPIFSTSNVKELPNEQGIFKTTYSTYKLDILDEDTTH